MTQQQSPSHSGSVPVGPGPGVPAHAHAEQAPPRRLPWREPARASGGGRSPLAPALAGATAVALIEAAVSLTRRDGARWLPHAMPASGWAGGYLLPAAALMTAAATAFAALAAWRAARAAVARHGAADMATYAAAVMASTVSADGMWVFFGTMHLAVPLRCFVFTFIDVAILALALRARDNMRKFTASGVDGLLMWAFTGGSALLASTAATSLGEVTLRLLVPLGAALLWERALVTERRLRKGHDPEESLWSRLLVRLGLADPMARTAGEAEQDHLITLVAQAVHRYNVAVASASGKDTHRVRSAASKMDAAMQRAMERTALWSDARLQDALATQVRMLGSVGELARLEAESPWTWLPGDLEDQQDDDSGPGMVEELVGELAAAQRDGDHPRLRTLLDGHEDIAALARCAVTTGAPKRILAAIALHAGPEQFASNAAAHRWITDATGQDHYLPDVREISRTRKALFPELGTSGEQSAMPTPIAA